MWSRLCSQQMQIQETRAVSPHASHGMGKARSSRGTGQMGRLLLWEGFSTLSYTVCSPVYLAVLFLFSRKVVQRNGRTVLLLELR